MEEFLTKWEADQARLRDHLRGQAARFQALGEALEGVRAKGRNVFMFGETSLEDIARVIAVEFLRSWPVVPISLYDDDLSDLEDLLPQGPASRAEFPKDLFAKDVPEKIRQLAQCFREGDAILAFVHEGESNTLRQTLHYARKLKVKILLVGGVGGKGELREPADVFLTLPTRGIKTLCEASFVCARLIARFARAEALEKSPDETAAMRAWSKIQDPKIQDPKIQDPKIQDPKATDLRASEGRKKAGKDNRGRARADELDEFDAVFEAELDDDPDADPDADPVSQPVDRRRPQTSQERRRKSKRRPQTGRIERSVLNRENEESEASEPTRRANSALLELDAELVVELDDEPDELDDEPLELLEASPAPAEKKSRRSKDSSRRVATSTSKAKGEGGAGGSERNARETRQRKETGRAELEKIPVEATRDRRESPRAEPDRDAPARGETEKNRRDSRGLELRRSKTEHRAETRAESGRAGLEAAEPDGARRGTRETGPRERSRDKPEREAEEKSRKRSTAETSEPRAPSQRESKDPQSQKNRAAVLSTASEPLEGYPKAWLGDNESVEGPLGLRQSTQSKGPEKSSNTLLDLGLESEDLLPRYIRDALDPAAIPANDGPASLGESGEGQRFVSNRFRVQECQLRFHANQSPDPRSATYVLASLRSDALSFRIAADDDAVETLCPGDTLFVSLDIPAFLEPITARARILGFDAHEDEDDLRVTLEIQSLGEDDRRRIELAAETISSKGSDYRGSDHRPADRR